jgi:hypothetical protein
LPRNLKNIVIENVQPILKQSVPINNVASFQKQPISGNRPEKTSKVLMSDFQTTPSLAYVDLKLSSLDNCSPDKQIEVRALHDSGCAKSVLKTSVFELLLELGHITVNQPATKLVLVSCTGEHQAITGLADITLHFADEAGVNMSFALNVIIHPFLSQDFLLGRDFTGSDAKAFETNDYLFLTDKFDIYLDLVKNYLLNKDLCKVPLVRSRMAPMHVAANKMSIIPPFSSFMVDYSLRKSDSKKYQLPSTVPRLSTLSVVLQYE